VEEALDFRKIFKPEKKRLDIMEEKTELKLMLYFMIIYILIFTIQGIMAHNYEFLYYTGIVTVLVFVAVFYYKKVHLSVSVIGGLTTLGALHLSGGYFHIGGVRLYDIWFVQGLIKYDNVVHFIGIFVGTMIAYSLLYPHLDKKFEHNRLLLSLILILIASGMGAFNEILELGAVVFLGAAKEVGDYMNNAIDLVFNLLGSLLACIYLMKYHTEKHKNVYKKKKI